MTTQSFYPLGPTSMAEIYRLICPTHAVVTAIGRSVLGNTIVAQQVLRLSAPGIPPLVHDAMLGDARRVAAAMVAPWGAAR